MDPTIEFDLIAFQDLTSALYFSKRILATALHDRVIFARTAQGNYAKLQIVPGPDLRIARLTVYAASGCCLKDATDLTIRNGRGCDLESASETTATPDFWWHEVPRHFPFPPGAGQSDFYIEAHPQQPALFYVCKGFDDIGYRDVSAAEFSTGRVEAQALARQLIYCRTGAGRFAKLLVEAGAALTIRRVVVYAAGGGLQLDRSNITLPPNSTLDLDTGVVTPAADSDRQQADLWWLTQAILPIGQTARFLAAGKNAAISFESYFRMQKYQPLLENPAIRAALVFVDASGTRAYDAWSGAERLQLREFLYLRETGRDFPIAGPPALTAGVMSRCDAWKIYLAHAAQSLWLDANARVPWRLVAADAEHLAHLFDMRRLIAYANGHRFAGDVMGYVTAWCPVICYEFLADSGYIGADQWETIKALARWCNINLRHISSGETEESLYGYHGLAPVDKMIYPIPGPRPHVTEGCWGTDGFLAAVLRSVNVPVRHGRSIFAGVSHSRAEFFSVGWNLAHGDDLYTAPVSHGNNDVPIERICYSGAELQAEIDNPPPRPGMTVSETASYNSARRMTGLAVEFMTDYLLYARCLDLRQGRTGTDSELWRRLHEYYSDNEIEAIRPRCDAALAATPRGCGAFFP